MDSNVKNWMIIDNTNKVINTILWDGDTVNNPYNPGAELLLIQSDIAGIGWVYDGKNFSNPNASQGEPQ